MSLQTKAAAALLSHLSSIIHMPEPEIGRRHDFTSVADAQHWLAGTQGLVASVISDSPLDVLGARFGYAGLIQGDDTSGAVTAWIVKAKDLPLDDIKNGRVKIYGAGGLRDDDVYTFMPDDIGQFLGLPVDKALVIKNPGHEDQSVHGHGFKLYYYGGEKKINPSAKALKMRESDDWTWSDDVLYTVDGHRPGGLSEYDGSKADAARLVKVAKKFGYDNVEAIPVGSGSYKGVIVINTDKALPDKDKFIKAASKYLGGKQYNLTADDERVIGKWLGFPPKSTEAYLKNLKETFGVTRKTAYPQPLDPTELITIGDEDKVEKNVPGGHDQTMHGQRYGDGFRPEVRTRLKTAQDTVKKAGGKKSITSILDRVAGWDVGETVQFPPALAKALKALGVPSTPGKDKVNGKSTLDVDSNHPVISSLMTAHAMWDEYYYGTASWKDVNKRVEAWVSGDNPDPGLDLLWAATQETLPKTLTLYRGITANEKTKQALLGTGREKAVSIGATAHWSDKANISKGFGSDILFEMKCPREAVLFSYKVFPDNGKFPGEREHNPVFRNPPKVKNVETVQYDNYWGSGGDVKLKVELEFRPWKPKSR